MDLVIFIGIPASGKSTFYQKYFFRFEATQLLSGTSTSQKNEILFQFGINYNNLPNWQKRGIGFNYEEMPKEATNPLKKEAVVVLRRTLKCEIDLPIDDEYSNFVARILTKELPKP